MYNLVPRRYLREEEIIREIKVGNEVAKNGRDVSVSQRTEITNLLKEIHSGQYRNTELLSKIVKSLEEEKEKAKVKEEMKQDNLDSIGVVIMVVTIIGSVLYATRP